MAEQLRGLRRSLALGMPLAVTLAAYMYAGHFGLTPRYGN